MSDGLVWLAGEVAKTFTARAYPATVAIGWRSHARNPTAIGRVVFSPADENGDGGLLGQPRQPGRRAMSADVRARALLDWERLCAVHCWAVDNAKVNDESAQIEAVVNLFENVARAMSLAQANAIRWGKAKWHTEPIERASGAEVTVLFTMIHPIYDWPVDVAYPAGLVVEKEMRNA